MYMPRPATVQPGYAAPQCRIQHTSRKGFARRLPATIVFKGEKGVKRTIYDLRHSVNPGITGWAQICYPYGASQEDAKHKLEYDLYYIKNYSLFLDLMILIQTAQAILWGKGER